MALAEYEVEGRTYLFDEKDVPKNAKLVTKEVAAEQVVLFPDQSADKPTGDKAAGEVVDKKAEPATPANKAGREPANKADEKPAAKADDKD